MAGERVLIVRRRPKKERSLVFVNHRRATVPASDAETVDEHEIAAEIEVQRPMGERWGETNYATVLRQSNTHTTPKSYQEENRIKVIPVRTAPEGASVSTEEPNGVVPQILENHHLASSSEQIFRVNELENTSTEVDSVKSMTISSLDRDPVVKSVQPVVESTNMQTTTQSDTITQSSVVESFNNQVFHSKPENVTEPVVVNTSPTQSSSQPNLDYAAGMTTPSKTYDRTRCFVCTEPVYVLEAIYVINRTYHKKCFRCHKCQRVLSVGNYSVGEGHPYCLPHYMEIFRVVGRYEGASMNNYNEFRLRQCAISSNMPSESERERPPPQVTRNLVAKFQQMSMDLANTDKRPSSIYGSAKHHNGITHKLNMHSSPYRSAMFSTPDSPKTSCVPTPFQQASQLQNTSGENDAIPFATKSGTMSRPDSSSLVSSMTSEGDLPNPGITRDLIAKFSALSST